jgi:subtilisin family serine protease
MKQSKTSSQTATINCRHTKAHRTSSNISTALAVLMSGLLLAGCGQQISESQKVHRAPTSATETGSIVEGLHESDVAKLLQQDSRLSVRVISPTHDIYEMYGAKTDEVKALIQKSASVLSANPSEVTVESNSYISLKDKTPAAPPAAQPPAAPLPPLVQIILDNQGVKLTGDALNFVGTCRLNKLVAPDMVIRDNQGRDKQNDGIYFDLGGSVTLDSSKTVGKGPSKALSFLWVVTSPDDSKLDPQISTGTSTTFTPDTTGLHTYSVVAKDTNGFCGIAMTPFYVTANDKFKPVDPLDDSWSAKINPDTFWHVFHVGAQASWGIAAGEGMTVAIIDTGVNYNHPALALNIKVNPGEIPENHIDDDKNGFVDDVTGYDFGNDDSYPFDDYGHGSHVAGIAASQVFGAARKAKILPVKFGAGVGFDIGSVIGAIHYAVDNGAKVLNMSFGWEEDLAVVRDAMAYAEKHNVLVVIAAGNDSKPGQIADNDVKPSYPCNYTNANIISVAATDENDAPTFYSNLGAKTVHLAAPGGTPDKPIVSSYKKNPRNALYVGLMGTSMATPLVVGVAAQVWSAKPSMTAVEVKSLLLATAKKSPALAGKISSGGVVDAAAALAKLTGTATPTGLQ